MYWEGFTLAMCLVLKSGCTNESLLLKLWEMMSFRLLVDNRHRAYEMCQLTDLGKIDFLVCRFPKSFMSANKVASKSQICPL